MGMPQLQVLSGTLNGQPVDSVRRTVTVRPGERIEGTIRYRTVTVAERAAVLLGAIALWGDRRSNWMVLRTLGAHGEEEFDHPLRDALSGFWFMAPDRPGRYRIVLTWELETEMRFIASRTNWILGEPRWNDGNDVADLSEAQLEELDRSGVTLFGRDMPPGRRAELKPLVGRTIEVLVR